MAYHKPINVSDTLSQINMARYECSDMRTDGWTAFGIKQDLYQIKWAIDNALRHCPVFAGEDEWVHEQEKKRLIEILKK